MKMNSDKKEVSRSSSSSPPSSLQQQQDKDEENKRVNDSSSSIITNQKKTTNTANADANADANVDAEHIDSFSDIIDDTNTTKYNNGSSGSYSTSSTPTSTSYTGKSSLKTSTSYPTLKSASMSAMSSSIINTTNGKAAKPKRKTMFDATKDETHVISHRFQYDEDNEDDVNDIDDDEDDNEWNELLSKDKIYTNVPPPGPKAFVDWYTSTNHGSTTSHAENQDVEYQLHSEQDCAVRNFLGPYNDDLHQKVLEHKQQALLRRRRTTTTNQQKKKRSSMFTTGNTETTSQNNNTSVKSYECASYKKLDTPVFQQYSCSLAEKHEEEEMIHQLKIKRRSTFVSTTGATGMGGSSKKARASSILGTGKASVLSVLPSGPQQKERKIGWVRYLCQFPMARRQTKNNPIGTYQQEIRYWIRLLLILIGIVSAVVIWCILKSSEAILDHKLQLVSNPTRFGSITINTTTTDTDTTGTDRSNTVRTMIETASAFALRNQNYGFPCFGYYFGFNMLFTIIAFLPVAYRPLSGGSGIAEAKSTLNGVILPTCTDIVTGACKAISVIFAGAASLPIGMEGPCIFIGLAIGHNAQRFIPAIYPALKLDEMKRDFAAVGCACGVAGAFLTPIGGVLFAMEEGASFWNPILAWRSFSAACVTTILFYAISQGLQLAKSAILRQSDDDGSEDDAFKYFGAFGLHDMAIYSGLPGDRYGEGDGRSVNGDSFAATGPKFRIFDFFFFALIGIVAGVLGALWIKANGYITKFRMKMKLNRPGKLIELLTLSILTTCVFWFVPLWYTRCSPNDVIRATEKEFLRQMNCPEGYYNQLSTLLLNPSGGIGLNVLYWEGNPHAFDPGPLFVAGLCYHVLLLLLFGSSTAMGIFIPLLYVGACYGRAFAVMTVYHSRMAVPEEHREAVMATYTMVCSIALLAGVARVLISLTIIMVCSISVTYMITPFMVATLFAKVVGKALFGEPGIYDCIIETRGIPFLETSCHKSITQRGLQAKDIMSRPPLAALDPEQHIGTLLKYLEKNPGIADYPVVDSTRGGILIGVVTRRDILTLLSHRELFYEPEKEEEEDEYDVNENGHGYKDDNTGTGASAGEDSNGFEVTATAPEAPAPLVRRRRKPKQPRRRVALNFDQLVYEHVKKVNIDISSVSDIVTKEDRETKVIDLTPYLELGHYTINQFCSIHRTFELFRSLGLRDLIVVDAFGRPIGVITRYDLKLLEDIGIEEGHDVHDLPSSEFGFLQELG